MFVLLRQSRYRVRETLTCRKTTGMKRATKSDRANTDVAERSLETFLAKFSTQHQILIREVRKALRKRFPTSNELVWDNYNFFVIGYSPTERPSDSVVSLAAAANGVGLSFYRGASLPDPHKILLGSGKQNRFIRLESAQTLARPEVEELIAAAVKQNKVPFSLSGGRKLIIRSVSKKQRPRTKPKKET